MKHDTFVEAFKEEFKTLEDLGKPLHNQIINFISRMEKYYENEINESIKWERKQDEELDINYKHGGIFIINNIPDGYMTHVDCLQLKKQLLDKLMKGLRNVQTTRP